MGSSCVTSLAQNNAFKQNCGEQVAIQYK